IAAVGPITAAPLRDADLPVLQAERGRLGSLVRAAAAHFGGGGAPTARTAAGVLQLRSGGAWIDDRFVPLSRTGVQVLGALFDARGGVVPRVDLLEALPGTGRNDHAVEMAVARVRESLGPGIVQTVIKRGYRLQIEEDDE
ncbi:winged helix-turn-helix domain-containing protein, partial [Microbacterium sp.]|uniref:winged helix-turn-helix domain-containing protein n=1 Tax=Microbacterium sp. TaxID=51671 RepID=UPI003221984F